MRGLVLLTGLAACGGTSSSPPPAPPPTALSAIAPRAGADDLEVARVNDRPVWGSCVVGQARRGATRAQALDQCIAFELMAQAAERAQVSESPEVAEATRAAMVSRLIETAFEDRYRTPADLGEFLSKVIDKNARRLHRPDVRASSFVRVKSDKKAPPDEDAKARALAQQIADALVSETGLTDAHLTATAKRIAGATELTHELVGFTARGGLEINYENALFSIPEIGRVVGPVRTTWGWDVILWTDGLPPKETTREELAAELFPDARRAYFQVWVNGLVKQGGITITKNEQLLADEVPAP